MLRPTALEVTLMTVGALGITAVLFGLNAQVSDPTVHAIYIVDRGDRFLVLLLIVVGLWLAASTPLWMYRGVTWMRRRLAGSLHS